MMNKATLIEDGEKTFEILIPQSEADKEEIEKAKYNEKLYCHCDGDINDMIKVDGAQIEGIGYVKKEGWFCPHCHKFINFEFIDENDLPDSIDKTLHKDYDIAPVIEFPGK